MRRFSTWMLVVGLLATLAIRASADPLPIAGVTASTEEAINPASQAVDGNPSTRWSGFGDGATLTIELAECGTVEMVQIDWYSGSTRVATFDVELSEDGTTWVPGFSGDSSGVDTGFEDVDVPDQMACFVRIVGHGNTVNDWNSISEVLVHGTSSRSGETTPISTLLLEQLCAPLMAPAE